MSVSCGDLMSGGLCVSVCAVAVKYSLQDNLYQFNNYVSAVVEFTATEQCSGRVEIPGIKTLLI